MEVKIVEKLENIFIKMKEILENNSGNFLKTSETLGTQAKQKKPGFHLYGNKEISLFGKKPKKTYIAGTIQQKNYVSFYLTAIYSHSDLFKNISPDLKKYLKGKSCFNFNKLTQDILQEIEDVLKLGINKYKELEWI